MAALDDIATAARACTLCAAELPLGPRPVLQVSATARLLITSQAPGTKVHLSGRPFTDASGDRLRAWLGISADVFYDASRVAILPMGLCYPGVLARGGDRPPMPICAPIWHPRLLPLMPQLRLTLLVGSYAIARRFGPGSMAPVVAGFRDAPADVMALPHPSWRTLGWERRTPWFVDELLPLLRSRVAAALELPQELS